ncbi:HMA2 domain-containing protein [Nitrosovibrio tenuis]|uniref:Uncharacterized protein n=1 Tax=Nitrosovibrio tenuis TaxID=1233 RepID=A0A1H7P892_9PROT|nr:hypothetical protein [Nitrosovibrio tenuis]SEL31465.1 hypothetical protein SAMN05216387_10876 [Nitrosovibrio tenuis]
MAPLARVVHALPGRKRIKVPEKRGEEAYFTLLKERLGGCPGVIAVETNPATAGVLIRYSENEADFLHSAAEQGLFDLTEGTSATNLATPAGVARAARAVPANPGTTDMSRHASATGLNMRRLIFLGLIGTGVTQMIEGNIAVPAVAAFWYALNTLPLLNDSSSAEGGRLDRK